MAFPYIRIRALKDRIMKTAILCIVCFAVGAIVSWTVVGYFMKGINQRQLALLYAGDVAIAAMHAEQMKLGEGDFVLQSIENSLPDQVIFLRENEMFKDNFVVDTALMSVKRFYVCTKTEIPERIAPIMAEIKLEDDACPEPSAFSHRSSVSSRL
jgi:hypothetical protein